MEIFLTLALALVFVLVVLFVVFGSIAWAISDAAKFGESGWTIVLLFVLLGPFAAVVWFFVRPSKTLAARQVVEYANPDDAMAAAAKLESLGEWEAAIALHESTAVRWPEHRLYTENCIQRILEKRSLG